MKFRRFLFLTAAVVFAASAVSAQERGFGMGVMVGEPTGVSAKGWLSGRSAIDAGLAWSFRGDGYIHAHMDYLWHFHDLSNTAQQVIPYVGIGGRISGSGGPAVAGVRVAGGMSWLPDGTPLDVFVELAPIVDLAPETRLSANADIGVRVFVH